MKTLAIVIRATSTEYAVYENGVRLQGECVTHSIAELAALMDCGEEGRFRSDKLLALIERHGAFAEKIDIAVSSTSAIFPPEAGAYLVTRDMLDYIHAQKQVDDTLKLGAFVVWSISEAIARKYEIECLPVVMEAMARKEIMQEALLSGICEIERRPVFHALSQRGAVRSFAGTVDKKPEDLNLIVAYLGSKISVGAHQRGRVIDCNSPIDGEGPFSPRTSGTLPTDALLRLCYSGKYDMDELLRMVEREGGLAAYLGSDRLIDVQDACADGNQKALFLVEAMAYKVAREIGARSVAGSDTLDAILFTGPWASFEEFTDLIRSYVEWIAPVYVYSWESELRSLAEIAEGVFDGTESLRLCDIGV